MAHESSKNEMSTNNALKMLSNKVTLLTILSQWILIAIALYQRGGWAFTIVHTNEDFLHQLLILLNIPALLIAAPFLSPIDFWRSADSLKDALILIAAITTQWWILGYIIRSVIYHKRDKKSSGRVPTI